ncbi:OLC1v1022810C1 [Oldenlandia corymbosa var. corymbosa]|uniref:OLC1v1022810C1 n=1 Tax=Oldenlandia corymbosa var. corymbosa TaxID=529605 RepID=A0AAV1BYX0_OLDCO|nr:OLC1v1022810C1 [Oldenlandia corymbosa var. corymbosa]
MEESMTNSMNDNTKADDLLLLSSSPNEQTILDSPEESSWTFYMQDFLNDHQNQDHDDDDKREESTTHHHHHYPHHDHDVSDAFSSSGKMACCDILMNTTSSRPALKFITSIASNTKQFSPKKRKPHFGASSSVNDLELEDTASSPANSPKVSYLNELYFSPDEKNKIKALEEGNNIIGRNDTSEGMRLQDEDQINNNNESDLKKKGLCLVPVSMLRNYFV